MMEKEIDIEKEKKFFKGIGRLLDIIGLLGVASSILILVAVLFDFSQYMGKYSEIGYLDVVFSFLFSLILVFLGNKIGKHDFYSNRYLLLAFVVIFPMPFFGFLGVLGIVLWILFLIRSIYGFLRIGKLRKNNKYQLVFDTNTPSVAPVKKDNNLNTEVKEEISQVKDLPIHFGQGRVPFPSIYFGIITLSVFLIGFSMFYYFFWRPYQKESNLKSCLVAAEDTLEFKKTSIEKEKQVLQEKRGIVESEVEEKRIEFKKNNPEPEKQQYTSFGAAHRLSTVLSDPWYKWSKEYGNLDYPLLEIGWKLDGLEKDSEIIKTEKEEQDEKCYKLYK